MGRSRSARLQLHGSSFWQLRGALLEHSSTGAKKTIHIEHKIAKKQDEEQALTTTKSDLLRAQKELDGALAYFDKLKPSCVDVGVSEKQLVREPSWRAYHKCGPLLVVTNSNSARWAMLIRLWSAMAWLVTRVQWYCLLGRPCMFLLCCVLQPLLPFG